MNILMINNFNYLRGGAETVFFSEVELFKQKGHDIAVFSRKHSQNLPSKFSPFFPSEMSTDTLAPSAKGFRSFFQLFYSLEAKRCLMDLLKEVKVDVAHVHNIYGRLTTSILDILTQKGIPTIMTLHDYKVICPNYKLMHHGKICQDCLGNRFYHAILNRCHKNSLIASTIYAIETYLNFIFKKYRKNIFCFVSPSKFLNEKLIEFGWPETSIEWVPNFLSVADFEPDFLPGNYFLYLGRLSSEKGIETLIQSFSNLNDPSAQLKVVGDGPLKTALVKKAAPDTRISFSGYLTGEPLAEIARKSLAVVVPSEWFENAPLSILEAMAYGKPVIGARIGGIPEMIDDGKTGFLFQSGNVEALGQAMADLLAMKSDAISKMGQLARLKAETKYNSDLHYNKLIAVYQKAIKHKVSHGEEKGHR